MTDERPPRLDSSLAELFVANAHGNFDKVRELHARGPQLVNAAWDWGGGDWETALGAAAHMGEREIALFLLEHGARLDVFAAAMLGYTEIVRAILEAHPETRDSRGPHGIPLLAHARQGGEHARGVVELLESAGAAMPAA